MSEPQHLNQFGALGGLGELFLSQPKAFNVLTETLAIVPVIDPEAAYGALHTVKLWCQLELTDEQADALITLSTADPYILHLLLRAYSFKLWEEKPFKALDIGDDPVQYALEFMRSFNPNWGGDVMTERVRIYVEARREVRLSV